MIYLYLLSFFGRLIGFLTGKNCGTYSGSYYIGIGGKYTRRPCVLAPGHLTPCVTDWEWNKSLNRHVRFWFDYDGVGIIGRAELS